MITIRVSKIRSRPLRRCALVALYPLMVVLGLAMAPVVAVLWFVKAQVGLASGAADVWRRP